MLARTLLTAGALTGALGGTAQAATLGYNGTSTLTYTGSAAAETVAVAPVAGGFKFTSTQLITVSSQADPICGASANVVTCSAPPSPHQIELHGGAGADHLQVMNPAAGAVPIGFQLDGGDQDDTIVGSSADEDWVEGGAGNDTITLNGGDDDAQGGSGDDTIDGGAGDDVIQGMADDDILHGGAGDDFVKGWGGADSLYGEGDDDLVDPGAGSDVVVDGGTHSAEGDTVSYASLPGPVVVDLDTTTGHDGMASETTEDAVGMEHLLATGADDVIHGTAAANDISAFGGDDTVNGRGGADEIEDFMGGGTVDGGSGDDDLVGSSTLRGGPGNDHLVSKSYTGTVDGGTGSDVIEGGGNGTLQHLGRSDDLTVDLSTPASKAQGGLLDDVDGAGPQTTRDTITGILRIEGAAGDDHLKLGDAPGASSPEAFGGGGDDELTGTTGADLLHGGAGRDSLQPGYGADEVFGDGDDDTLHTRDASSTDKADCGGGVDVLVADPQDVASLCETVQLPPPPPVEPPVVVVRPPVVEQTRPPVVQNGTPPITTTQASQPTSAVPGRLSTRFATSRRGSIVRQLSVTGAPLGAQLTLLCRAPKGRTCPITRFDAMVRLRTTSLLPTRLRGRRLAPGTRLEVRLQAPGRYLPRTVRVTVRRGIRPLIADPLG